MGGYSPCEEDSPDIALTRNLPPTWYHVANWEQAQDTPRWLAWDVLLGLWASRDILVAYRDTILTVLGRCKRGDSHVLYAYATAKRITTAVRNMIRDKYPEILILDNAGHGRGLAASFPNRHRLWAIHHGRGGRCLEAGHCGDEVPEWSVTLHFLFTAILSAASQAPHTTYMDVQVAQGSRARPSRWPRPRA